MRKGRRLTELEGCVLGLVWERGPCTAYQVRKVFLASSNPAWSGSAGAIYPLVERLERRGLLESEPHFQGRRRSRLYRLSRAGREGLVQWLNRPDDPLLSGVPPDPLRTRLSFLGVLSPARRHDLLAQARARIAESLGAYREQLARGELDRMNELVHRGAAETQEARLRWLDEVLAAVEDVR